jgi:hypothetical protein
VRDGFLPIVREMHLSFESLTIIVTLQASLMDIHHDTSLRSILKDDSNSSACGARICSCLGKGVGIWLVARLSIRSFHITHFIFTLVLHFHLGLIQPLTFSLFMCECEHELDAFGTHLVYCLLGGQRIATHDAI